MTSGLDVEARLFATHEVAAWQLAETDPSIATGSIGGPILIPTGEEVAAVDCIEDVGLDTVVEGGLQATGNS
jgi:hypothetical protein